MTIYYESGPMRINGRTGFNYDVFNEVEDALWVDLGLRQQNDDGKGHAVINPARNFDGDSSRPTEEYLTLDLKQVLTADVIVLLPGWENSEGAKLEVSVARATGKRFMLAHESPLIKGEWRFETIDTLPDDVEGIEQEARRLVYGERAKTYGHPRGDFDRVAGMWTAMLGIPIDAEHVALMMIAFKLARLAATPEHRDSQVDVIGYALALDRLLRNV